MATSTQFVAILGPDSYELEPQRHPHAIVNAHEPYNAEPLPSEITKSFITPVDFFYKRNHGPVPVLDHPEAYRIRVSGLLKNSLDLSLDQIKNLPKHTIVATLQCAGNRRTEMSQKKTVRGVGWGLGAIGNAKWGGARLSDVLSLAGVPLGSKSTPEGGKHVEFISVDKCKEEKGGAYRASIPLTQSTSLDSDVLLAYEMNDKPLNRDHGFPLRVIVPGVIGARSVKWITDIVVRSDECQGFFQQLDYKMLPPWIGWHNVDFSTRRPIMDFPVQSAITSPLDGGAVSSGSLTTIRGYAVSGSGRGIERVDVSVDGGVSWREAEREAQGEGDSVQRYVSDSLESRRKWSWTFWNLRVPINSPCEIIVRAVDEACNVQPESVDSVWNLRGVLNNSWHRITVSAGTLDSAL